MGNRIFEETRFYPPFLNLQHYGIAINGVTGTNTSLESDYSPTAAAIPYPLCTE